MNASGWVVIQATNGNHHFHCSVDATSNLCDGEDVLSCRDGLCTRQPLDEKRRCTNIFESQSDVILPAGSFVNLEQPVPIIESR
jgi:hypothetical protein